MKLLSLSYENFFGQLRRAAYVIGALRNSTTDNDGTKDRTAMRMKLRTYICVCASAQFHNVPHGLVSTRVVELFIAFNELPGAIKDDLNELDALTFPPASFWTHLLY